MRSSVQETTKQTWLELINESVHTSGDIDIGDIETVSRVFIIVKRGCIRYIITIFLLAKYKDGMET